MALNKYFLGKHSSAIDVWRWWRCRAIPRQAGLGLDRLCMFALSITDCFLNLNYPEESLQYLLIFLLLIDLLPSGL